MRPPLREATRFKGLENPVLMRRVIFLYFHSGNFPIASGAEARALIFYHASNKQASDFPE
jgi:hypothetical protein